MKLRFLVDECVPVLVSRFLEDEGHDVVHVSETPELRAQSDAALATVAQAKSRIAVTSNWKDWKKFVTGDKPRRPGLCLVAYTKCQDTRTLERIREELPVITSRAADAEIAGRRFVVETRDQRMTLWRIATP